MEYQHSSLSEKGTEGGGVAKAPEGREDIESAVYKKKISLEQRSRWMKLMPDSKQLL